MNSHDKGLAYALATPDERQRRQNRQNMIADVADAMENGFKAEPDLSPCHLQLLSDEALAMVFKQSEKWRDHTRERELESELEKVRHDLAQVGGHYSDLRRILGADHIPHGWRGIMGQPQHIAYTEQIARELVAKCKRKDTLENDVKRAEWRVDLLERYVLACDAKRVPYNWNVFKMPTDALSRHVHEIEAMEKLTRCDCNPDRVAWFETRTSQETEQSLRWHVQRAEETRKVIEDMRRDGFAPYIGEGAAEYLLDVLLGREQWTVWEWEYKPRSLDDADTVDIETKDGKRNTLEAGMADWSQIKRYRRVK